MREGKRFNFRVWDDKLRRFIYFDLFSNYGNVPVDLRGNIQQSTGLTSKEGAEIYEGDICATRPRSNKDAVEVKWVYTRFDLLLNNGNSYLYYVADPYEGNDSWMPFDQETASDLRIVGNIFENPELLLHI